MTAAEPPVPLSELERDLPSPVGGWSVELDRRGVAVVTDDLGRAAVDRAVARDLFAEHRENEARMARHRVEIEQRLVEAERARVAALPPGLPFDHVPAGLTPAMAMMASDPDRADRRRWSVLEDTLGKTDASITYHPINEQADQ